jgi:hypothetical protein
MQILTWLVKMYGERDFGSSPAGRRQNNLMLVGIPSDVRNKAATTAGQRDPLHFSVSFPSYQRGEFNPQF